MPLYIKGRHVIQHQIIIKTCHFPFRVPYHNQKRHEQIPFYRNFFFFCPVSKINKKKSAVTSRIRESDERDRKRQRGKGERKEKERVHFICFKRRGKMVGAIGDRRSTCMHMLCVAHVPFCITL